MFEKEAEDYAEEHKEVDWEGFDKNKEELKQGYLAGAEYGYNKANEWHLLKDGYPEVDKLVRIRTFSGMEHICEVTWYYPDEDEIGYGSAIISFYELNGEWIDDNDIKSWCELQPVPKEFE